MIKAEKKAFVFCSLFLMIWMVFALFFSEQHEMLERVVKNYHVILEDLRISYNSFVRNNKRASELNNEEYERLISTSYSMIYKREYEQLREYLSISDQMDLSDMIRTGVLINTYGTREEEILRIIANETIPQNGYLVSPALSAVIGKIKNSRGKTAEIIPIWNEQFSAQVMVKKNESKETYPDLALIEKKQVINFNPAFPYSSGDTIYISEYEPGGYTLSRYEWTRIGKIASVKQNEIVEKYGIEYDFSRKEILEERYFFIVE